MVHLVPTNIAVQDLRLEDKDTTTKGDKDKDLKSEDNVLQSGQDPRVEDIDFPQGLSRLCVAMKNGLLTL